MPKLNDNTILLPHISLSDIELEDGEYNSTIQGVSEGTYYHPLYGVLEFNQKFHQQLADNFNEGVVETDICIDWDHNAGPAAGWINNIDVRDDGLYLDIKWTKDGARDINTNRYKYFSPTIVSKWKHPKTQKEYENVLFGGALTNRPFLKDMSPVSLHEYGGKKLATLLEQVQSASKEDLVALGEILKDKLDLTVPENNEEVVTLTAKLAEQDEQIKELREKAKVSDINIKLAEWNNAKYALPVALHENVISVLKLADSNIFQPLVELFDELTKVGTLYPEADGKKLDTTKHNEENFDDNPVKNFTSKVAEIQKELKLSYIEATKKAVKENPQMYSDYMEAVRSNV